MLSKKRLLSATFMVYPPLLSLDSIVGGCTGIWNLVIHPEWNDTGEVGWGDTREEVKGAAGKDGGSSALEEVEGCSIETGVEYAFGVGGGDGEFGVNSEKSELSRKKSLPAV